jgi:hypothetical protein
MARKLCKACGGPKNHLGKLVDDPLYMQGGICFDCLLASYLPKELANLEWQEQGGAYGAHGIETGVPLLDAPSIKISQTLQMGSHR